MKSRFFLITLLLFTQLLISPVNSKDTLSELKEIEMIQEGTGWTIRETENKKILLHTEPDDWQGNSDIYHVKGGARVGHLWSQFLMLAWGSEPWLTDRVESEGQFLVSFNPQTTKGKILSYNGTWGFRDYFETKIEVPLIRYDKENMACNYIR